MAKKSKRTQMRMSRVNRVLQMATALQFGRKYRSDDLAKILSMSKRTLQREIKELGKIGIPCDYNQRIRSYEVNTIAFLQAANLNLKEVVGLHYHLSNEKEMETDLEPYHLFYGDYGWYVINKSGLHTSIYTFKLSSIKALETLKKCFSDGNDFNIYEYFGRAWLTKPKGLLYNIKLRFSPQVARTVTEVQWHRSQTSTRNKDGSEIIEFRVDGLGEITWWILSYGDQVQVLAPRILREKIVKIAKNISKYNKRQQKQLQLPQNQREVQP